MTYRKHILSEVASTVTGCLRTQEATAPALTLTGISTGPLVLELLVLTEHETNLTAAYTYITSGNVGVRTDVTIKLVDEALAETHYLSV